MTLARVSGIFLLPESLVLSDGPLLTVLETQVVEHKCYRTACLVPCVSRVTARTYTCTTQVIHTLPTDASVHKRWLFRTSWPCHGSAIHQVPWPHSNLPNTPHTACLLAEAIFCTVCIGCHICPRRQRMPQPLDTCTQRIHACANTPRATPYH